MPIEFYCPGCQRRLRVPDGTEGRLAQCPMCGIQTPIPGYTALGSPSFLGEQCPSDASWTDAPQTDQQAAQSESFRSEPFSTPAMDAAELSVSGPTGQTAWPLEWYRQYAYARISTPANWLVALSAITFGLGMVSLVLVVLGMAAEGHRPGPQGVEPLKADRSAVFVVMGLGLLLNLLLLLGSMKMKQLENYPLAMTAALLAIIPCTSPCCVLSMPFGLWALVVLTDPAVKAAFK
ncbi:MAG: hypothetical protein NZ602_08920 [Thermoguttaceae bacterium]|nr:hypothetical protein [Thermoguttaceae bacterium]MDW8037391.1 hypothetical protein [Thermoguttaceae bacterium]